MLLINCGRKGSSLQTPKIPRTNIIKSSLCTSQPHHSAQPRLGPEGKITPLAAHRSLHPKWRPQEATHTEWMSAGGRGLRNMDGGQLPLSHRKQPEASMLTDDLGVFARIATDLLSK